MRRRDFVTLLGGAVAAWPLAAHAQQAGAMPLIGVIMPLSPDDSEAQARLVAFRQALQELGWIVDRNVRIEVRWGAGDGERNRSNVAELLRLGPDVVLATGSPTLEPLLRATRTLPIVFVQVSDPVGAGLIESLARPGANATGFTTADYTTAVKWLELLKEIAPTVKRVAFLRDPNVFAGIGQWGASSAFAASLGLDLRPINVSSVAEMERSIQRFAQEADCGMVVTNSGPTIVHRDLVISLAARYRLPAIYPQRLFAAAGGLIAYGSSPTDPYRRAAGYVDRILKGARPGELPVQNPTQFELVINLRTAKALGLPVPATLLARADEVIE